MHFGHVIYIQSSFFRDERKNQSMACLIDGTYSAFLITSMYDFSA